MGAQHLLQTVLFLLSCRLTALCLMRRLWLHRRCKLAPAAMLLTPSSPTQTPCRSLLGSSRPLLPQTLPVLLAARHLTQLLSRKAATLQYRSCTSCSRAGWSATSWMPSAAIGCSLC